MVVVKKQKLIKEMDKNERIVVYAKVRSDDFVTTENWLEEGHATKVLMGVCSGT